MKLQLDAILEAEDGPKQSALLGKRRSERNRAKRMREPDKKVRVEKGVRRAGGPWRIKRTEVPVSSSSDW